MARIYSTHFYSGQLTGISHTIPGPASGDVQIIRDMTFFNASSYAAGLGGLWVTDAFTTIWFALQDNRVRGNCLYEWHGRVVVAPGDATIIETFDSTPWHIRVSGYLLTT
jgi:hypothetical protein